MKLTLRQVVRLADCPGCPAQAGRMCMELDWQRVRPGFVPYHDVPPHLERRRLAREVARHRLGISRRGSRTASARKAIRLL